MITALLSFIGVVIGASLQYVFTRHIEDQRHIRNLRSKAYMDYLKNVAELANFRPQEKSKERTELMVRTADAKARISLYGSNRAIEAFSEWEQLGPTMASEEQRQTFISMVHAMREDSGGQSGVNLVHIAECFARCQRVKHIANHCSTFRGYNC